MANENTPHWEHFGNGINKTIYHLKRYFHDGTKIPFIDPSTANIIAFLEKEGLLREGDKHLSEEAKKFIEGTTKRNSNSKLFITKARAKIKSYNGTTYFDDQQLFKDITTKTVLRRIFNLLYFENLKRNDYLLEDSYKAIIHIINELDRNVRNHSGFKDIDKEEYFYSSSMLNEKGDSSLNFSILDYGQGFDKIENKLKHILKSNESYNEDVDYVLNAVKKGVTTKTNHSEASEYGKNSGYGLFILNTVFSDPSNKLEILSGGKYFINDFQKDCLEKEILPSVENNAIDESINKITMITFSLNIKTLEGIFEKLNENTKDFSSKSSAFTNKSVDALIDAFDQYNRMSAPHLAGKFKKKRKNL